MNKISDRLRFVMSQTDNPKLLEICAKIAKLNPKAQEAMLDAVESGVFSK